MMLMKKFLICLAIFAPLFSCVGQKDDPEPIVEPEPDIDVPVPEPDNDGPFLAKSLVLDFTGTWCVNCPKMQAAIQDASAERPGRLVSVSVHCLPIDPMSLGTVSTALAARFGVSAYPSAVVDLDKESLISTTSSVLILNQCDRLMEKRGVSSGIRISTAQSGESGFEVSVEASVAQDGDFSFSLLLLEDGITAPQTGAGGDYVHNDVLREWIDCPESFPGKRTGDVFSTSAALPGHSGMRVAVLLMRDGLLDNAAVCVLGESIDYLYDKI